MRNRDRWIALASLLALVLGMLATPASAQEDREAVDRIGGADRIATAAELAEATFASSDRVLLARAWDFPDALASAGLAGHATVPTLITRRETLTNRTAGSLQRLETQRVTILGGPDAVGPAVEDALDDRGYAVDRIQGPTRYDTAAEVARAIGADQIGQLRGERAALIATGERFPDALTAGPLAYARVLPIVLTPTDHLHDEARAVLGELGIQRAVLVGGPRALAPRVQEEIEDLGIATERVAGRDRTDTSAQLADLLTGDLGWDPSTTLLSRGDAFPDALAAAAHGGEDTAPILLSRAPDLLSYDVLQWTVDHAEAVDRVRALGEVQAVSERILHRVAETAVPPERELTYSVAARGDTSSDLAFFAEHVDWTLTDQRGWSLDNDVRWTWVADEGAADVNIYLATPAAVGAAADGCSPEWSCQPAGTNDVYINEQHWQHATETYDQRTLDDYRHYVVLHELGHAPPMDFGHIRCEDHYDDPDGEAAPVMEQQSQREDVGEVCTINVWPLPGELESARDRMLGGGSVSTSSTSSLSDLSHADQTYAP